MEVQFKKISELVSGRDLFSTDLLVAVQNEETVKITGRNIRPYFEAILSGTSVVLLQEDHGLEFIRSVRVTNPMGSVVEVDMRVIGADLEISSNVPLDGHKLFLE